MHFVNAIKECDRQSQFLQGHSSLWCLPQFEASTTPAFCVSFFPGESWENRKFMPSFSRSRLNFDHAFLKLDSLVKCLRTIHDQKEYDRTIWSSTFNKRMFILLKRIDEHEEIDQIEWTIFHSSLISKTPYHSSKIKSVDFFFLLSVKLMIYDLLTFSHHIWWKKFFSDRIYEKLVFLVMQMHYTNTNLSC